MPTERHGLPDVYPLNEEGYRRDQAEHARWFRYEGPTENTVSVTLTPGEVYELWPGGELFNSAGTLIGRFVAVLPPDDHASTGELH